MSADIQPLSASKKLVSPFVALLLFLTGCATVTGSTNQTLAVQTLLRSGPEVGGVGCELTNDKGRWFMVSPGSISVRRSNEDMQVYCNKKGYESGRATVVSDTKSEIFGNVLVGGGIGALVDHRNGAAYAYPGLIRIILGESLTITPTTLSESKKEDVATTIVPVAATVAIKPVDSPSSRVNVEEKLRELNRLYNAGLITREVYVDQQKRTLSEH